MLVRLYQRRVVTALVVLLFAGSGAPARDDIPQAPAVASPGRDPCEAVLKAAQTTKGKLAASILWDVNEALRRCVYERLPAPDRRIPPDELPGRIATLNSLLATMVDAGPAVHALGKGLGDDLLLYRAERHRAAAWLHAWATFSRLAQESSRPGVGLEIRKPLLAMDGPQGGASCLARLLTVYRQMRDSTGRFKAVALTGLARDAEEFLASLAADDPRRVFASARVERAQVWRDSPLDDPLQVRLCDENGLGLMLAYQQPWAEPRPAGVTHDVEVPSVAFLVGNPDGEPSPAAHAQIHTLWSLVNRQLDTWQAWTTDAPGAGRATALDLGSLEHWLRELSKNVAEYGFGASKAPAPPASGAGHEAAAAPDAAEMLPPAVAWRRAAAWRAIADLVTAAGKRTSSTPRSTRRRCSTCWSTAVRTTGRRWPIRSASVRRFSAPGSAVKVGSRGFGPRSTLRVLQPNAGLNAYYERREALLRRYLAEAERGRSARTGRAAPRRGGDTSRGQREARHRLACGSRPRPRGHEGQARRDVARPAPGPRPPDPGTGRRPEGAPCAPGGQSGGLWRVVHGTRHGARDQPATGRTRGPAREGSENLLRPPRGAPPAAPPARGGASPGRGGRLRCAIGAGRNRTRRGRPLPGGTAGEGRRLPRIPWSGIGERGAAALLKDIRRTRIDGGDLAAVNRLRPLVLAATPDPDGSYLYDAAIWLRYLILLSYQNEGIVVGTQESAGSLAKVWSKWEHTVGPLHLPAHPGGYGPRRGQHPRVPAPGVPGRRRATPRRC